LATESCQRQDSAPAGQNEEGRLENVFRILRCCKTRSHTPQTRRSMAVDQQFEGRLIASPGKALEQLAVGLLPLAALPATLVDVL